MSKGNLFGSLCLFLLLLGTTPIDSAVAEGRCPPAQYPIGDQGVGGCAPISGAGQSAPEENPGHWVKTGEPLRGP